MIVTNTNESAALSAEIDWERVADDAHLVQIYENDERVIRSVAGFIGGGLRRGRAAVIVATSEHRSALDELLAKDEIDVAAARRSGSYVTLDAAQTLSRFSVAGRLDRARFVEVIGGAIERAAARAERPGVRAFGEMVALLWQEGRCDDAIELESMWNDLARSIPFSLFCAYPSKSFQSGDAGRRLTEVCAAHSHVISTEETRQRIRASGHARVLIVEDNVDAAQSLKMLLEILGHAVVVVDDGLAALGAARRFRPDVMLVDIGLPGMSGYEVAREIRREPLLQATALVAVSGYGRPQDRERARAAGFDHHFRKPIELGDLGAVLGDQTARNAATKFFHVSSASPARIGK